MARILKRLLIGAGLVVVVLLAGIWLALRSETVQRTLLERANVGLESALGLRVEARGARLRLLSGVVELEDAKLVNDRDGTLAEATSARGTLRLRSLLRRRVEISSIVLDDFRFDLAELPQGGEEPLPESPADSEPESSGWTVAISSLQVRNGELAGVTLPEGSDAWASTLSFRAIELEGSLREGRFEIELEHADAEVGRPTGEALHAVVTGEMTGPLEGPYDLSGVRLDGPEIVLALSGTIGISDEQPMQLGFDFDGDAGRLLDPTLSATLAAEGELDFRAGTGRLRLDAPTLPAELLSRWIEPDLFETLAAAGTSLGVEGDVRLGPGGLDRVTGRIDANWRREEELLVTVALRPESLGEDGLRVPFELSLSPALDGRREVEGVLQLVEWNFSEASVEGGALRIEAPNLRRTIGELSSRWPALVAGVPDELGGALELTGSFAGPVASPAIDLLADWRPAPGSRVRVEAIGEPTRQRGRLDADIEGLSLASFDQELRGLVGGRLELEARDEWTASFDIRALGLAAGGLEDADVLARGSLADGALRFTELTAEWQGHRLETEATIGFTADGAHLSFDPLSLDSVTGEVAVDVPAVLIPSLPLLDASRWRTAASRARRLRVAWRLAEADYAALLGAENERLEVATDGDLWIDLDRPSESSGELTLSSLTWASGERQAVSQRPIVLSVDGGYLRLAEARLSAPESYVEVGGTVGISEAWRVGDPLDDLPSSIDLESRGRIGRGWVADLVGMVGLGIEPIAFEVDVRRAGEAFGGRLMIDGAGSEWLAAEGGDIRVSDPRLELELSDGALTLSRLDLLVNGEPLEASGSGRLTGQALEVDRLALAFAGIESEWSGALPFGGDSDGGEARELRLEWRIPESDLGPALGLFELLDADDTIRAGSIGSLRVPLSDPTRSAGLVEITGLEWVTGGRRTTTREPLRLRIADGRLELEPLALISEGQVFDLRGHALLGKPQALAGDESLTAFVRHVELHGSGTLLTSLLNPILAGAVAEGYLTVELEALGPPDQLTGRLTLEGSEAALTYPRPYATRLTSPRLEIAFETGGVARLEGSLMLNEGRIDLSGGATTGGVIDLEAKLDAIRYRLDYGLLVLLNGDLGLVRNTTGAWELAGTVEVENGLLTREIDLDFDLILQLLAPVDLSSTEASVLDDFSLDLDLTTLEGVRVKNNVADMLILWDPVRIGGTLAAPVFDGRFEIEPGGRIHAFGQTVRIDSGSIDYPGVADLPATLELSTTSSFEDPSIATLSGQDPFASSRDQADEESDRVAAAATGLGTFYGERLANRLAGRLSGASVSLQPLLIFGETDPGARLTVSQDFSPQVTVAASADLRAAEERTYLLDVHALDRLPGLNAQAFTTDTESQGLALRQRVRLGPGGSERDSGPKVRGFRFELPERISKRRIRRTLGLRKGDRLAEGGGFAAEVEVAEYLRGRGFSDARADVEMVEVDRGVELVVTVQAGPKATFEFVGEKLPKQLRRAVIDLYRSDFYEATALEEMADEARRALRSLGYLEPSAEVIVALDEPTVSVSDRVVTVTLEGGRRINLERVRFGPLPADEATLLEARFSRPVRRTELAAGVPDADRRVEQTLRYLGYVEPRIVERRLSESGHELDVVLEPGPRPGVATVEVHGVDSSDKARLEELVALAPGAPLRSDKVAATVAAMRDELQSRGFVDARVEARIETPEGEPDMRAVHFDVDPGTAYFIGEVAFTGLRSTREGFAREVADLELEEDFSEQKVLDARRRLWRVDVFETVKPEIVRAPGGNTRVDFKVNERKPYEFGYGLRWDSEESVGVLAEIIDRNFIGHGWTVGLRAQWAADDQALRAFAGLPRLFDARSSLGLFGAVRQEVDAGLITDTIEATLQLGYELSSRLTGRLYGRITESRVREEVPLIPDFPFDQRATRPVLGTQLLYDDRRGDFLYDEGLLATADFSFSDEFLGSDFNYARFFGQANYFRRILPKAVESLVWAQSLRVGVAEPFGGQVIARPDRFFAGGEFSVRGYLTETLGPQDILGSVRLATGGEALLILNEELRWRVTDRFTTVVFLDAGNVWADIGDFGADLVTSTGIGLRALTPVGLLRLDLAHALDPRPFDPEFKVYVGFGTTF